MQTLNEIIPHHAQATPDALCAKCDNTKVSYQEINNCVDKFAETLAHKGVQKGDRVALLLHNSVEYIIAFFAIQKLGAVTTLINTYLTTHEIVYILKDCEAKMVISSDEFNDKLQHISDDISNLDIVKLNQDIFQHKNKPTKTKNVNIDKHELAVIIYTSGTSGNPRGVMLSHNNLMSDIRSAIKTFTMTPEDRFLCLLPMFHAYTINVCVLLPLVVGAKIFIIPKITQFDKVIKALMFDRITLFVAVPTIYNILAEKNIPATAMKLLALRICVSGGAALPQSVFDKFTNKYKLKLIEGYGLSEAAPYVAFNPCDGPKKINSVGVQMPDITIKIVDDQGNEVAPYERGEIIVQGENIMMGYYNRPEDTANTIKDGWLYTGDIAYKDDDGYIFIVDRKKDIIIINGMNVYPREIEEMLYKHPDVLDAAVIGLPDDFHGELPHAYIVCKDGAKCDEKKIRAYLKENMASFKIPKEIVFMNDLPRTATDKVMKRLLKDQILKELKELQPA